MDEKKYLNIIKKIKKVIDKMEKMKEYDLSGTGWQDYYSGSEIDKLYKKNEKIQNKKAQYRELISEMLGILIQFGYTNDEILKNFEVSKQEEILPLLQKLNSYSSTDKKR